nr:vegetative cell wall protein gp1-like [Aegilops tauschii subsp. strangulata]
MPRAAVNRLAPLPSSPAWPRLAPRLCCRVLHKRRQPPCAHARPRPPPPAPARRLPRAPRQALPGLHVRPRRAPPSLTASTPCCCCFCSAAAPPTAFLRRSPTPDPLLRPSPPLPHLPHPSAGRAMASPDAPPWPLRPAARAARLPCCSRLAAAPSPQPALATGLFTRRAPPSSSAPPAAPARWRSRRHAPLFANGLGASARCPSAHNPLVPVPAKALWANDSRGPPPESYKKRI